MTAEQSHTLAGILPPLDPTITIPAPRMTYEQGEEIYRSMLPLFEQLRALQKGMPWEV